jgi:uncharacterized protein YcnI
MKFRIPRSAALALAFAGLSPACAHVTIETKQAAPGTYYKAVLRVPHGCAGSATTRLRVRIPDGVIAVKPQPKPGWTLEIVSGKYDTAYTLHGNTITQGVRELSWTGNLPDAYYDEFVFSSYLTPGLKPGGTLYFPVVQECERGVERWIGQGANDESPAPAVKLLPQP